MSLILQSASDMDTMCGYHEDVVHMTLRPFMFSVLKPFVSDTDHIGKVYMIGTQTVIGGMLLGLAFSITYCLETGDRPHIVPSSGNGWHVLFLSSVYLALWLGLGFGN